MLALSRHGSRVLNQDCVTYASQAGIALFAKSTSAREMIRGPSFDEPTRRDASGHRIGTS